MKKNRISGLLFLLVILAVIGYSAHEMVNQGKMKIIYLYLLL